MHLAGERLDLGQCARRRIAAAGEHDHIGLADRLARPYRCFAAPHVDHQRRHMFEIVEPFGDFGRVEFAPRKHRAQARQIDDLGAGRRQPFAHPGFERRRQRLGSAIDQRHRSRPRRRPDRDQPRGFLGEAPRQCRHQRLDDGGRFLGELLVGGARQHQHAGIANGNDIGRARDICKEADLADQFAGAKLGERLEFAGPAHRERAMQHHEQCVRGAALRDQHFPAHEILTDHGVKGLEPLLRTQRSQQREIFQHVSPPKCRARSTHGGTQSIIRRRC